MSTPQPPTPPIPPSDEQPERDEQSSSDSQPTSREITPRELKLTAALYASRDFIWRHVQEHGTLPPNLQPLGGGWIGMRLLIERRGTDITLTEREQKVLEAIRRGGRLSGGSVLLIDDEQAREAPS